MNASLLSALGVTLFGTLVLPACAADAPIDELAGESEVDGEAGKGDTVDAFTYFQITPDARACSLGARCGGFFVERPNRTSTTCKPGESSQRCYVDALDLSGTAMPRSVQEWHTSEIRNGQPILLRGEIVVNAETGRRSLAATEVWLPGSTRGYGVIEGTFVFAKHNGITCVQAPCPQITESRLNANRSTNIDLVDFTASSADVEGIDRGYQQLYDGDGIIAVGDREYGARRSKIRTANQFWSKAPVPLH